MRRKTAKSLTLSKETLRNLVDLSGKSLQQAAGGTYTWSCSCECSNCELDGSKSCCL